MASNVQSSLQKLGIKPFNKDNLLFYYAPIYGIANYGVLAVKVMHPNWINNLLPKKEVINYLIVGSIMGNALYMSNTKLMTNAPINKKSFYCICNSMLFTFGSVLVWAVMRNIAPDNIYFTVTIGLASGFTFTAAGKGYLDYIDSKIR